MNSQCSHHHHHDHNHKHESSSLWNHHGHSHGDLHGRELLWAVIINVLLTVVQLVGGVLSGSLALVADAVHNFSDAGSLALAAFVRKVSGRPPSDKMTFGFGRAEILGALVNSTTLVAVGLYLLYESIERFYNPQKVEGEIVVGIAAFALIVDLITVGLTYKGAKESVNIRAAFIHNLSDAFASVVVMISGALILWLQLSWIDLLASLLISVFILYHSYLLLKECLSILMQAVPSDLDIREIGEELKGVNSVIDVHHIHIWQMHERFRSLEAHIVICASDFEEVEKIKQTAKLLLKEKFRIHHSTLELELASNSDCGDCNPFS